MARRKWRVLLVRHASKQGSGWYRDVELRDRLRASGVLARGVVEQQTPATNPPLSAGGQAEAVAAAAHIARRCLVHADSSTVHAVVVVTSPYLRCQQTAVAIARRADAPLHEDSGFSEVWPVALARRLRGKRAPRVLPLQSLQHVPGVVPQALQLCKAHAAAFGVSTSGEPLVAVGESGDECRARALSALRHTLAHATKCHPQATHIVVCTHAGVIAALCRGLAAMADGDCDEEKSVADGAATKSGLPSSPPPGEGATSAADAPPSEATSGDEAKDDVSRRDGDEAKDDVSRRDGDEAKDDVPRPDGDEATDDVPRPAGDGATGGAIGHGKGKSGSKRHSSDSWTADRVRAASVTTVVVEGVVEDGGVVLTHARILEFGAASHLEAVRVGSPSDTLHTVLQVRA